MNHDSYLIHACLIRQTKDLSTKEISALIDLPEKRFKLAFSSLRKSKRISKTRSKKYVLHGSVYGAVCSVNDRLLD